MAGFKEIKNTEENLKDLPLIKVGAILLVILWIVLHTFKLTLFAYEINAVNFKDIVEVCYRVFVDLFWSFMIVFFIFRSRIIALFYFFIEVIYITLYLHYYEYFNHYFHFWQFLNVKEGTQSLPSLLSLFAPRFLIIANIDIIPALCIVIINVIYYTYRKFIKGKVAKTILIIFVISMVINEVINFFSGLSYYHILFSKNQYSDRDIIRRNGTFLFAIREILNWKNLWNTETLDSTPIIKFNGKKEKFNIILIQVESLDSSLIFTDYKSIPITPFLRSLTTNSWYCPVVISYHFAGATSDAEFSILNSKIPSLAFPSIRNTNSGYPQALPRIFNANGYVSYAFHNNLASFFGRDEAFPLMGFMEYYDRIKMGLPERGWGACDEDVFNYVKNKLKTEKKPFFYFIITMSSHAPFIYVANYYTNKIFEDIKNDVLRNYFNSFSYVDAVLSNFVAFVRENNENTHILIVGDHSSALGGKSKSLQQGVTEKELYQKSLSITSDEILEIVPLFFIPAKSSKIIPVRYIRKPISFLDISPTIIEISGVKAILKTHGTSLLKLNLDKKRRFLYKNRRVDEDEVIKGLQFKIPEKPLKNFR